MACLVFSDTAGRQVVYALDRDRITIGRGADNDIVSLDLRVSRRHASLSPGGDGGAWVVRDEGSSLGVFVNQRKVERSNLRDGDVIRVGDSLYSFVELPGSPLESLGGAGGQSPAEASLRGGALVAELQEAIGSLRSTIQSPGSDRRILDQCLSLVEARLESLRRHLVRIERARMMLQTLHEVGKVINSSYDRGNLLEIVLDQALRVVRAERGFLTLYDAGTGRFERRAAIHMGDGADAPAGGPVDHDFSTGIALSVAQTGLPIVTTDAQADERFRERQSVMDLNIRSALCVPLVDRSGVVMGVLYADTRASVVLFSKEDQDFLMAFSNYASIAIENAALFVEAAARARAEEELVQARKLDEIKSDLISIVSHDVRTPLTSIRSYAEILHDDLESLEPSRVRHFLDIINREADRLSRLVTNYLDLQKIEAGMMLLSVERLEVAGLLAESIEAFEGAALEKGVALGRELEPSLPSLKGDRDRLLQVFANLMSNALKFTPPGGAITLAARAAVLQGRGPAVTIAVTDTGEGMAAEQLEQLFKRFSQVGASRSESNRGTGLGLVFSREIVELHGGRISVTSRPGEGTSFEVTLPLDGP